MRILYNKKKITWSFGDTVCNLSSFVEKYFTRLLRSLGKYFLTLKENFISLHGHVISSIYYMYMHRIEVTFSLACIFDYSGVINSLHLVQSNFKDRFMMIAYVLP